MNQINQTFKCPKCGNIVEILRGEKGVLTCCNQSMLLLRENTQEAAEEKHIPVVFRENNKLKVIVGEVEHPMTEDHSIEWVEIITEQKVYRHIFSPGEKPECYFEIPQKQYKVRAYCNLHGLWSSKLLDS